MVDPVTFKVFGDNTHIVTLRNTGNVFAYDTVERLNIKAKMWRDLVSNEEFGRKDIITLQDPHHIEARNLSSFKYLQDGVNTLGEEQRKEQTDSTRNINKAALGNAADFLTRRKETQKPSIPKGQSSPTEISRAPTKPSTAVTQPPSSSKTESSTAIPYNAATHTTGKAAASFTSTGLTPHTSADRALLSAEEYMLHPRRVRIKGYARIRTNFGSLNLELYPEYAPRAVWNFVQLAKSGYYNGTTFHRSIRNFMLQGGDPTGTGKGGKSIWGRNFKDEFDGPLTHDARGVVSMANKGKDTNSSQFFIIYRPAKHLDRKHTVFGKAVGGLDVLSTIEGIETDKEKGDRPREEVRIEEVVVFVDPFEEFERQRREAEEKQRETEEIRKAGGTEDDKISWTGKRVGGGIGGVSRAGTMMGSGNATDGGNIGKYLGKVPSTGHENNKNNSNSNNQGPNLEEWEGGQSAATEEPARKKQKQRGGGGFGNFDNW